MALMQRRGDRHRRYSDPGQREGPKKIRCKYLPRWALRSIGWCIRDFHRFDNHGVRFPEPSFEGGWRFAIFDPTTMEIVAGSMRRRDGKSSSCLA